MKYFTKVILILSLVAFGCKSVQKTSKKVITQTPNNSMVWDVTIAFGSCNNQRLKNLLWDDVLNHNPKAWIWGGDNVYADTRDMEELRGYYTQQANLPEYKALTKSTKILGTWDDHDYGLNDGGLEFDKKQESQQEFLDFMGVTKNDARRNQEGVYHSETIETAQGSIKIIVLDTRYFRSALLPDTETNKRFKPNLDIEATILGKQQWVWLEEELKTSTANFNLIVSSIQFLSGEHGFETWANFPYEVEKLKSILVSSKAKGIVLLSGDRHISEFSKIELDGINYPIIDFTSSGLTHSYTNYSGEPNKYRVGKVVPKLSYGVLKFNFDERIVSMEMRGDSNKTFQVLTQRY